MAYENDLAAARLMLKQLEEELEALLPGVDARDPDAAKLFLAKNEQRKVARLLIDEILGKMHRAAGRLH